MDMVECFQWAQFPPIHYKGDRESCGHQEQEKAAWNSNAIDTDQVHNEKK